MLLFGQDGTAAEVVELDTNPLLAGAAGVLRWMRAQLFNRLTPEEIYPRFHGGMQVLQHTLAACLTQIDYGREIALVLSEAGVPGRWVSTPWHGLLRIRILSTRSSRCRHNMTIPVKVWAHTFG